MRIRDKKSLIRDPGWKKLDPGSGMEKVESGIQDGKSRIWDGKKSIPGWKKVGSGMEKVGSGTVKKSWIRDKHPGSATQLVPTLEGDGDDEDAWIRDPRWVKSQDPDPGR